MDFSESKEELDFKMHVRKVINEKIKPEYSAWRSEDNTPKQMFQILGEAGLLGFREIDGNIQPIPWLQNIHYYKEMAQFSGGIAIASFAHSQLGVQALFYYGNETQKADCMVPGLKGEKVIAFANTEPGAGSDAAAIQLKAEDEGDHFLINGTKSYITNGDFADHIIFTGITHPDEDKRHKRISMFLVDGDATGLTRHRIKKLPWKMSHLAILNFKNVEVPKENLVGELQHGFYQTMNVFNTSRIGISALSFGTGLGAFKLAYKHATNRQTFGKRLIDHESKKNEFAEQMARLEAAWLLVQKAAFLKDTNSEFRFNSSMAKLINTENALDISLWATELYGARGVLSLHPVSEFPLDAKGGMVGEGAPEVQKKIIAENIEKHLDSF
jgi:alkylation response protein AidB-like acyl-CoA dehydrogenase